MTLIGVKSKYGSCSGNCTEIIYFNYMKYIYINIYKVFNGKILVFLYNIVSCFGSSPNRNY